MSHTDSDESIYEQDESNEFDSTQVYSPVFNIAGKFEVKSKLRDSLPIRDGKNFIIESNSSDSSSMNFETPVINTAVGKMIVTPIENTFEETSLDASAFINKSSTLSKNLSTNSFHESPWPEDSEEDDEMDETTFSQTPIVKKVSKGGLVKKITQSRTPVADYVSNVDGIKKLVKPKTPTADYVSNVRGIKKLIQPGTPTADYLSNVDGGLRKLLNVRATPKADYMSNVGYIKKIYKPKTPPANYEANLKGLKKMILKAEAKSPQADYTKHVDFSLKRLFFKPKNQTDIDILDGLDNLFEEKQATPPPVKRTKKLRTNNVAEMLSYNIQDSPARSTRSQKRMAEKLMDPPKMLFGELNDIPEDVSNKKNLASKKTKKMEDAAVDKEEKIEELPKKKRAASKKNKKIEVIIPETDEGNLEVMEAFSKKPVARKRTRKMVTTAEKSSDSAEDDEIAEQVNTKAAKQKPARKTTTKKDKPQDSDNEELPKPTARKRTKKINSSTDSAEPKAKTKPKVSPRRTRSRRVVNNKEDDIDFALSK